MGHETQITKPGDYFISPMGEESVIMARDRENAIHVFLNSCTHPGMKVRRYDEGNTPIYTCPYHGWNYAQAASRGTIAKRYPYKNALGMHMDPGSARYTELTSRSATTEYSGSVNEHNQRGMYKFCAELMDAESWDDLFDKRARRDRKLR